ncbi:GspE/PulE/PilB domain-containing protein [Anaeromyxobacter oryzae]|uniref:Type II secretion system protein GspE N-terminal domain-containing protein n=1 Tax=Anaeromyxobacter oryzae TaxID=2918170 RepID=A0ABM7WWD2_9BACT|nr:HEAT repeat domain-containing protein [Anaeromyxobacter oryzae]BDG03814.1 hypothetical protein AMOR_28100 [Anaeromyxobacter oryzae]
MPTDLAALLVDEGAVAADAMERAEARRREAGGALDTALLELGLVDEERLVDALSRAADLPPAPAAAWEEADPRARRVFPSRVAERHGLAPFALGDRELSLVATYPVDLALLDEISFMLSLHLTAHVGPEWRVRALIHRLYGGPLEPRLAALAAGTGAPRPADAPPDPAPAAAAPDDGFGAPDASIADAPPVRAARRGFARDASEPLEPLAAALAQALESEDLASLFVDEEDFTREPAAGPAPASPDASEDELAGPPAPASDEVDPRREEEAGDAEPEPAPRAAPDRTAPPRWSLDEARATLAAAPTREEVVLAALRYARDFFEFAAMFAVTRDAVVGHDALGTEDARERCRGVAIYTSDPGLFRTVIDTRAPHLGPMPRGASGNEAILDGLARGTPRTTLVFPVLLRDRTVCVLYADNGEAPVSPRRLGNLLLLLSALGAAFERLIRDRKDRRRGRAAPPARPEPVEGRADSAAQVEPRPHADEGFAAPERPEDAGGWVAPAPAAVTPTRAPPAVPEHVDPWMAHEPGHAALDEVDIDVSDPALVAAAAFDAEDLAAALVETAPGSAARQDAIRRLAGHPAQALPALIARLPGPVETDDAAPEPAALGPIPAALAALGARAVPALLDVVADPDPARRRAATVLLGAAGDPATFSALVERALDADPLVASAAVGALGQHRRDPAMRGVSEKLRRALLSGLPARSASAARALGALRDAEAIPLLVQVLEAMDAAARDAAADALARITLQRLGTDPRRWLGWWKENRGRGRAEWLFSGLTSADRAVRVEAAAELADAAAPPVDYSADAPPAERESAARAWAGWWARSGRIL